MRQFHQYLIRIDGSGRQTLRNRKFVRKITPVHPPAVHRSILDDLPFTSHHPLNPLFHHQTQLHLGQLAKPADPTPPGTPADPTPPNEPPSLPATEPPPPLSPIPPAAPLTRVKTPRAWLYQSPWLKSWGEIENIDLIAGAHKEKEHLTPQKSCYLSGVVMWYKLTNPQETNIALNIITSTGNDIQIFPNYHIWRYLVKPLRQQLFYTVRCSFSLCAPA